jgi:hypothetical protein
MIVIEVLLTSISPLPAPMFHEGCCSQDDCSWQPPLLILPATPKVDARLVQQDTGVSPR